MIPGVNNEAQAQALLRDGFRRKLIEQALAHRGLRGDTMIAHINPREALALKMAGGAGTPNPSTGLPQFYGAEGGSSPDARGGGLGSGASTGDSGTSDSGLGGTQGGLSGDRGGGVGVGTGGGWGGIPGDTGLRGPLGQGGLPVHTSAEGYGGMPTGTPGGAIGVGGNMAPYNEANRGWQNRGFLERAFDWGQPFGFADVQPDISKPQTYSGGTYHTGWNPGGAFGSLASMALGGPAGLIAGPLLSRGFSAAYNKIAGGPVMLGGTRSPTATAPGSQAATASGGGWGAGIGNAVSGVGDAIGGLFSGGGTTTSPQQAGGYGGGYGGGGGGYGTMPTPATAGLTQTPEDRWRANRQKQFQMARMGQTLSPAYNPA